MNIFLLTLFGIVIFLIIVIIDSVKDNKIERYIQSKKSIIDVCSKIFLGVLTVFIAIQANAISKRSNEVNIAETAPLFDIQKVNDFADRGYAEAYKLINEKGTASYVSFSRIDTYSFIYLNKHCSFSVFVISKENINTMEENLWYYVPVIQDYNNYDAAHMMEEYFYEHTGEKIQVNTERVFSVDFADYKNEMFNFYFHYRNNGTLNLAYRDSEAYYSSRSLAYESLIFWRYSSYRG
ncbi:hypothetical protein [Beduini massiliensis]|uniref:hypothetical protein n=1 Tax=Beduini massiliensis TaxID=1585974 RepID=UPI00059A7B3C|nr:hypothetical protein [Beduini massiliensis]